MKQLIKEINKSLDNENYLSALALTLTLPDICGKISYPELKGHRNTGERYKRWYNEYIYPYELSPKENDPYREWVPDGSAIYRLRCNLFHDGSVDISESIKKDKKLESSTTYKFVLTNIFTSYNLAWMDGDKDKEPDILIRIGVKDFCEKICAVVKNIYSEEKDIYNDVIIFDFD